MKKLSLLLILSVFLASCNTSKVVTASKKTIKGDWTLTSVTYNQEGKFNVELLDEAPKACFEGSTWSFVPNNSTGRYTINGNNCPNGERYFIFKIQEVDAQTGLYAFLLKPTDAKNKSVTNSGYRLKLTELSEAEMQWQQTVSVDGEPFIISMNFSKS